MSYLSKSQRNVALALRDARPAVIPGTNVIPSDSQRLKWYDAVTTAMAGMELTDEAVKEFCDVAGVPN